ncbi:MAG TPA: hypothetical protein VLA19_28000 [Herpetosiphonaceae bacterium]|nr:hypothetical protein [Herpetosiphonaceae bacterium]
MSAVVTSRCGHGRLPVPTPTATTMASAPAPPVPNPAVVRLYYLAAARSAIYRSMFWSVAWIVVAGVITLATYVAAGNSDSDGTYVFWWGPMAFGASKVLRGGWKLRSVGRGFVPERFRL